MVKFSVTPVAMLAVLVSTCVLAQDPSSASSTADMASSTAASSSSSAAPTSMASSSAAGGGGDSAMVCTVLGGDPRSQPAGCPYSSTSTPPYDLNSLISYFIGGYTRGPEGKPVDEVAGEMAGSVLKYYPTLLTPEAELQSSFAVAISNTINAIADGSLQKSDLAPAGRNVPENLIQYGIAAAAVVAAGAFAL